MAKDTKPEVVSSKPTMEQRAMVSVVRRIIGSFGYRAAQSENEGFDPTENLGICKALEMKDTDIPNSVSLYIDSFKPQTTDVEKIATEMECTVEEAGNTLKDAQDEYQDALDNRDVLLESLAAKYGEADQVFEVSDFAYENIERVLDRAISQSRRSYIRTGDKEWVVAVKAAAAKVKAAFSIAA